VLFSTASGSCSGNGMPFLVWMNCHAANRCMLELHRQATIFVAPQSCTLPLGQVPATRGTPDLEEAIAFERAVSELHQLSIRTLVHFMAIQKGGKGNRTVGVHCPGAWFVGASCQPLSLRELTLYVSKESDQQAEVMTLTDRWIT